MHRPHRALRASAGTGKTYALVETYASAVLDDGLSPQNIVVITFTKKAAAELRLRIQKRLEQHLCAKLRRELSSAPLSNFHGLALQILRSAGKIETGAGATTILGDSGDDRLLFVRACEEAWFPPDKAAQAPELHREVLALARYFDLDEGLPHALWDSYSRAREDGAALDFGDYNPMALAQTLRARVEALVDRLTAARSDLSDKARVAVDDFLSAVPKPQGGSDLLWAEGVAHAAGTHLHRRGKLGALLDEDEIAFLKDGIAHTLAAEILCADLRQPLSALCARAVQRYQDLKAQRNAWDFGDLVEQAVALLEYDPHLRATWRERVRLLLVDEAQDTNRLQRRFVHLLSGFGTEHAARLVVVGDPKQAIYTFRGADPDSFDSLCRDVASQHGEQHTLATSYRSTGALIAGINHLGEGLFGEHYDRLEPRPSSEPLLERASGMKWVAWRDTTTGSLSEAQVVADLIQGRLAKGARAQDFAVILSASSHAPRFAEALAEKGIPSIIAGGGGFYDQREVIDVLALLQWLAEPGDLLALAIVLRSPLVGISDGGMLALLGPLQSPGGQATPSRDRLASLRRASLGSLVELEQADRELLEVLSKAAPKLHEGVSVQRPHAFVREVYDTLSIEAVYLALPRGEQRVANLERLLVLAIQAGEQGLSASQFIFEQEWRRGRQHREPLPQVGGAPAAVTLTTVHQSKGLEFEEVVLADLAHASRQDTDVLRYERSVGLAFRPRQLTGALLSSQRWEQAQQASRRVAGDELKRLLYVATTRAKSRTYFVCGPKPKATGFMQFLQPWREAAQQAGVLTPFDVVPTTTVPIVGVAADATPRRRQPRPSYSITVTELEQLLLPASAESAFGHDAARPTWFTSPEDTRVTEQGILLHAVLARLGEWRGDAAGLKAVVQEEVGRHGFLSSRQLGPEIASLAQAFFRSPLGQMAHTAPADARKHEWPFCWQVSPSIRVWGQVDLLLWNKAQPTLLDFKYAAPRSESLRKYQLQLELYACAVAACFGTEESVATHLVFFKDLGRSHNFAVTAERRLQLANEIQTALRS